MKVVIVTMQFTQTHTNSHVTDPNNGVFIDREWEGELEWLYEWY